MSERTDDVDLRDVLARLEAIEERLELLIAANKKTRRRRVARLAERLHDEGDSAFAADPRVLAEGEFLKAQLGGVQGTEEPRPLFLSVPLDAEGRRVLLSIAQALAEPERSPTDS
jgi:hypothetical protein